MTKTKTKPPPKETSPPPAPAPKQDEDSFSDHPSLAMDESDASVTPEEEIQLEATPNYEVMELFGSLRKTAVSWAPAYRILILLSICTIAILSRVFSVIRYESIIHEFDPWFNFRATKILVDKGWWDFKYWVDSESWFPLGRYSGHTLFPGLMMTAAAAHKVLHWMLIPIDIRNVCVFLAPVFAAGTAMVSYLLAMEVTKRYEASMFCALFMALIPSYISRSVAGSYDNEAVAIFAVVLCFWTYVKAVNTGTMLDALISAIALYYMILSWGGYVFVLGIVAIFVLVVLIMGKFNIKVYVSYSIFYIVGSLFALCHPFVGIWQVWSSSEHLPTHVVFIIMQFHYFSLFIKDHLSAEKFKFLQKNFIRVIAIVGAASFIYLIVMGHTTWGHRILTLINPVYAKKHNPLVASISEHQSTSWGSFFFDFHFSLIFAPPGLYFLFAKRNSITHSKLFMAIYFTLSIYFSAIMIRLLLVSAPAAAIVAGCGVSYIVRVLVKGFKANLTKDPTQKGKSIPLEMILMCLTL
jgi:dolichyl-diphosphooligosaccharide--protein glycosyltransferase